MLARDAQRAKLIGETKFGTGTVLDDFTLAIGSEIFLATVEWLTPKSRVIWCQEITPDVIVNLAAEVPVSISNSERSHTAAELHPVEFTECFLPYLHFQF